MKRLLITGPRQAKFEEVDVPACPRDGVLVRARWTAISTGTELRVYRAIPVDEEGRFLHERVPYVFPTENGYSMTGDVVEVGADVTDLAKGDRVFATAPHKEIAAVPESLAIKLPEAVQAEDAVFFNILEVSHRAIRVADPSPGANVAIIGQGVIGLAALAYCTAFGFRTATADLEPVRREIATQMGACLSLSPDEADFRDQVRQLFDGGDADVVFEAASNWGAIRIAMELAATDAKIVIIARHTSKPDFNPVGHPFLGKRLSLMTTYGYPPDGHRWDRRNSIQLTLDLLARRKLSIGPMRTHEFTWDQLPDVYRRLDQGDRTIVGAAFRWPAER